MGLDIYCSGECERVGSYSYVHINRRDWVKSTILYLQNEIKKQKEEFLKDLADDEFTIDYIQEKYEEEYEDEIGEILNLMLAKKGLEECLSNKKNEDADISSDEEGEDKDKEKEKPLDLAKLFRDQFENAGDVDYSNFEGMLDLLIKVNLSGVYWWVFHSDCEGRLSPGQAFDIISSLKKIYKWMENEHFGDEDKDENKDRKYQDYYLYRVFQASVENEESITFG